MEQKDQKFEMKIIKIKNETRRILEILDKIHLCFIFEFYTFYILIGNYVLSARFYILVSFNQRRDI